MVTCAYCGMVIGWDNRFDCGNCSQSYCADHRLPERHDCTSRRMIRSTPRNEPWFGTSRERPRRRNNKNRSRSRAGGFTARRKSKSRGIGVAAAICIVAVGAFFGLQYMGVIVVPAMQIIPNVVTVDPETESSVAQDYSDEDADHNQSTKTELPNQTTTQDTPPDQIIVEPEPQTIKTEPPNQVVIQAPPPDTTTDESEPQTLIPSASLSGADALQESRQLMLDLINEERVRHGLKPVSMGSNAAAQAHADSMLARCTAAHWGSDGLKPYMRYSLAGGYQHNAENVSGLGYCVGFGYVSENPGEGVREAMQGLMTSPGHRDNILDPNHAFVNIGVANDGYNTMVVQHFEYDHIEFESLPEISGGIASFSATIPRASEFDEYAVTVYYDPPPHPLTPGQLSRTYCYDPGTPVVSFRPDLQGGWEYTDNIWTSDAIECPDPYNTPPSLPAPSSPEEALRHHGEAVRQQTPATHIVPWSTTNQWKAFGDRFEMKANMIDTIKQHGPGVYTFSIGGFLGDEYVPLGEHAVFHDIPVPGEN